MTDSDVPPEILAVVGGGSDEQKAAYSRLFGENERKVRMLYTKYGTQLRREDMDRKRLEKLIDWFLPREGSERAEFEIYWQEFLKSALESTHAAVMAEMAATTPGSGLSLPDRAGLILP